MEHSHQYSCCSNPLIRSPIYIHDMHTFVLLLHVARGGARVFANKGEGAKSLATAAPAPKNVGQLGGGGGGGDSDTFFFFPTSKISSPKFS